MTLDMLFLFKVNKTWIPMAPQWSSDPDMCVMIGNRQWRVRLLRQGANYQYG